MHIPSTLRSWRLVALGATGLVVAVVWFGGREGHLPLVHAEEPVAQDPPDPSEMALPALVSGVGRIALDPGQGDQGDAAEQGEEALAASLRIRTVDELDAPLPEVRLHRRDGEGVRYLGTTNQDGFARVPFPADHWGEIVGTRQGYAAASASPRPAEEEPRTLTLTLHPGAALQGQVVLPDGRSAGPDLVVVAFPLNRTRSMYVRPSAWMFEDPEAVSGRTDPQGRYQLTDVDAANHYTIFAGGKGFVLSEPLVDVHAGDELPELVVRPGFGVLVELREPDGSVPAMDRFFGAGVGVEARFLDPGAFFVKRTSVNALLSGIAIDRSAQDPWDCLFLGATHEPLADVLLDFSMHPPGYAPVQVQLVLKPLSESLQVTTITLIPEAEERGSVIVERVSDVAVDEDTRWQPFAILSLRAEYGETWNYPLVGADERRHAVENVPYGRYSAAVRLRPAFYKVPARGEELWIEVGPEPAVIHWGNEVLGGMTFVPPEDHASGADAELEVFLVREGGEHSIGQNFSFRHPPYSVPFLEAGTYTAMLAGEDAERLTLTVRVEPGERALVPLDSP